MPDKLEININTLTPIWTGGVEAGKCDRIHETGILGSLRWWMEVLVRGVGGNVCDPTEHKCLYDPKKSNNGICDICQIFGATGWKRRFRIEVVQDNTKPDEAVSSKIELRHDYKDREGKTKTRISTWWFPKDFKDKPRSGRFTIQIQSLHPKFKPEVLSGLIQFIADWSALGARSQMGFGVIEIEGDRIETKLLYDWLINTAGSNIHQDIPSLQNIFMAQIKPKGSIDSFDTFNLKYDLRNCFRAKGVIRTEENKGQVKSESKGLILKKDKKDRNGSQGDGDKDLRHFIMGAVEDERMAAKIKISSAYKDGNLMRVWGWIPEKADVYKNGWNREKVVDAIYQHLTTNYTLHEWWEMNSTRNTDTDPKNIRSAKVFLHSLLKLQERGDAV
jgi:CRISPR-associated protein Cmr1